MPLNTEVDYNNVVIKGTVELGVKGERGLQGFKGDQGIQGPPVPVAHELGDDPELAVSQKMLTDSIADMEQSNESAVMEATRQAGLAEAARDAAFVNADVYPTVAAGLAAVADGEQFQVLTDEGLEYRRYRKDSATVATEVGDGFPTPKQVEGAVHQAENAADRAEAASDAAFVNADVYPDVATGRAAVVDGEQFQVVVGPEVVRYRRDSSTTQTEVARYPAGGRDGLSINAAQEMPLMAKSKDGVTGTLPQSIKRSILDIRVIGARLGKYYRLAWVGNGVTINNVVRYDILFDEYEAANFAANSSAGKQIAVGLGDILATSIDTSTPIITRVFNSTRIDGLSFVVTYMPGELPVNGSVILNDPVERSAPGYIIDESRYIYRDQGIYGEFDELKAQDSLTINLGKVLPLQEKVRDGANPALPATIKNSIADIKVIGARPGKYYRLEWINNGSNILGASRAYGVIFHEYDKDTFSTNSGSSSLQVFGLADADTSGGIDVSSPIITRTFVSPVIEGLSFVLTYKPDELPTNGYVAMNVSAGLGSAGRGYIIDESRYIPSTEQPAPPQPEMPLTYSFDSNGQLQVHWQSHNNLYRVHIGPVGHNVLPNIRRVDRSGSVASPSWVVVNSATTDWLPPLTVRASSNGDSGSRIFTGGNHGSSGGESGDTTARNVLYNVLADGRLLGGGDSGRAGEIRIQIVNELMAYNTITVPRYVLRQTFDLVVTPGAVAVECEVKAYEDLEVLIDYGPQMVTTGYRGTMLFVGGQIESRTAYVAGDSGPVSQYPDAFATVLQDATNGQQVSWVDRSYGAGSGDFVATENSLAFTTSNKAYNNIVYKLATSQPNFLAGESYKWRGGYAWQAPGVQGTALDSLFQRSVRGVESTVYVYSGSDFTSF